MKKLLAFRGILLTKYQLSKCFHIKSYLNDLLLTMPRENKHRTALQKHRIKLKEKNSRYSPGTVNLQILGSGATGAPRCLYLFTDQSRYLFNCGEGSQRLAHEHKMKLSKLEHIFVTHGTWENIGGLPGVALTIQDAGVPEITLHGPNGIDTIFSATRRFVILRNLSIKTASCSKGDSFEDNAIQVKYIPITIEGKERAPATSLTRSPRQDDSSDDDTQDYYAYHRSSPPPFKNNKRQRSLSLEPKSFRDRDIRLWLEVMCFAVKLQPRPGRLCLEKCVDAGVKPGPLLGRLKAGEDVVLDDGTIVRSEDVTLPNEPSPTFLVVECPNEKFLPAFESEPEFLKYQNPASEEDAVFLIAHFTPPNILNQPLYKKWMDRFPPNTYHLIINESNKCMGSTAVHLIQHKLNILEPNIFPLLNDPGFPSVTDDNQISNGTKNNANGINNDVESDLAKNYLIINGKTFSRIHLRPQTFVDDSFTLRVDPDECRNEIMNIEGFSEQLANLNSKLSKINSSNSKEYPSVTFLGTGSCIPNKARNTSAILINMSETKSILLDCGEGTYGQLVRHYGPKEVNTVLSNISAIFISHLHADHHIGLTALLKAIIKLQKEHSLLLIAPKQIEPWLTLYDKHFEPILHNLELVPNKDLLYNNLKVSNNCLLRVKDALDINNIQTAYVNHCPHSFGIAFQHKSGWKLTYSGDTLPSQALVDIGMNSDLLIHEATMEDELANEAKHKLHSTTSQAIDIGRQMSAKFIMLTHFSQRYAKLPRIVCETTGKDSDSFGENVGIAFDNMKVRFSDFPTLHLLIPALKLMFQDECDELEQKALKRSLKFERMERKKLKISSQ